METNQNFLQAIESVGLESLSSTLMLTQTLKENFMPFIQQAEEWKNKASELVVTDVSQVAEMKLAREARLALKEIRINADKKRVELKEDSLKYGKAVQSVYNFIESQIKPIEKYLEEQEKFSEIQEAKRKSELKLVRQDILNPYMMFVPYGLDLGELSEEDFEKTLNGARLQLEAQKAAQKKAEEERIAKEKEEAENRERLRLENIRLKEEADRREMEMYELAKERKEIEEKAKKQKAEIEAKLKKEKGEKEKMEAELELLKNQKAQQEEEKKVLVKIMDVEEEGRLGTNQLAVDWLEKEISHQVGTNDLLERLFEKAKLMQRDQHGKTWDAAIEQNQKRGGNVARSYDDFDQYYYQTYKGGANE